MTMKANSVGRGLFLAYCVAASAPASANPPGPSVGDAAQTTSTKLAQAAPGGRRPEGPPPKGKSGPGPLAAAAKELGITERQLADAVGPTPPSIERGAQALGIPAARLKSVAIVAGHAPVIGLVLDGHLMFARLDAKGGETVGLDECRGKTEPGLGYHYHVADAGKNEIIGCIRGEYGCALDDPKQYCDARRGGPMRWFKGLFGPK